MVRNGSLCPDCARQSAAGFARGCRLSARVRKGRLLLGPWGVRHGGHRLQLAGSRGGPGTGPRARWTPPESAVASAPGAAGVPVWALCCLRSRNASSPQRSEGEIVARVRSESRLARHLNRGPPSALTTVPRRRRTGSEMGAMPDAEGNAYAVRGVFVWFDPDRRRHL